MTFTYKKLEDGRFECVECGEIKNNQSTMHYHMISHGGNLPFKCKFCEKSFAQKSALEIHKKAKHDKQRIFVCPAKDCDYECSTKSNCRVHYVRNHIGAKPLDACEICQKECKSAHAYYYHVAACHPFTPEITADLAKVL